MLEWPISIIMSAVCIGLIIYGAWFSMQTDGVERSRSEMVMAIVKGIALVFVVAFLFYVTGKRV